MVAVFLNICAMLTNNRRKEKFLDLIQWQMNMIL